MDINDNGYLTLEELKHGLHKLGHQIPDTEIKIIMEAVSFLNTDCILMATSLPFIAYIGWLKFEISAIWDLHWTTLVLLCIRDGHWHLDTLRVDNILIWPHAEKKRERNSCVRHLDLHTCWVLISEQQRWDHKGMEMGFSGLFGRNLTSWLSSFFSHSDFLDCLSEDLNSIILFLKKTYYSKFLIHVDSVL